MNSDETFSLVAHLLTLSQFQIYIENQNRKSNIHRLDGTIFDIGDGGYTLYIVDMIISD